MERDKDLYYWRGISYETKPMVWSIDIDISTQETHYSWSNCDWAYDRCYYKIEIATLMPPTNHLRTTEPTWIQAKYKLPLGQKSQHGYRSSHTIFGPPRATKESKLTLDLNTEQNLMNSVISTHGLNTSEKHRRPSRKLGRTRRQHVTTVQASIV